MRTEPEIRPAADADVAEMYDVLCLVFGGAPTADDLAAERSVLEIDRALAAHADGRIVGCLAAYSHDLSVPGGALPVAGTTWVGVLPTHRRQGVLRRMMAAHLRDVAARGEPVAALWASEAPIYGRFGYGQAMEQLGFDIDLRGVGWRGDPDATVVRLVDRSTAAPLLDPVWQEVRRQRPGLHARNDVWWAYQVLSTREETRGGAPNKHVAVAERDGTPVGYAVYGTVEGEEDGLPTGRVQVTEVAGVDPDAEEAVWRYLCAHDLSTTLRAPHRPADDVLPWRVTDPRRVRRTVGEGLWVRLVDVPAALRARGWADAVSVTLQVHDPLLDTNDRTWRLQAGPGDVTCEPADGASPDLVAPVAALGAAYLGGVPLERLARAGSVRVHRAAALTALDAALRVPLQPWAPEVW